MNIPADMAFTIRACIAFCGFELNKNRKIYNKTGKIVPKLSYDTLRLYLRPIKLPAGKLRNRSRTEQEIMEKWLNWLKQCFDLE